MNEEYEQILENLRIGLITIEEAAEGVMAYYGEDVNEALQALEAEDD